MTTQDHTKSKNTACQCPLCVDQPAPTYTPEYMQECLARWLVNATSQQREEFLAALCKQKGGHERITDLKVIAERLGLSTKDFLN